MLSSVQPILLDHSSSLPKGPNVGVANSAGWINKYRLVKSTFNIQPFQ